MLIRLNIPGARKRRGESCVELPEGATVRHALEAYAEKYGASYDLNNLSGTVILRNKAVAWYGDVLEDGDEVTLLRLFSTG